MGEVFAGFVCGYILALLSTPMLAITLLRLRGSSELLARLLPAGVSALSLTVILHGALFFFWTAAGIILGLILLAMGDGEGWLASRHGPFSLFILGVTLALTAPLVIAVRPWRQVTLTYAVLALVVFGWLMPYMAGWSRFDKETPVPERAQPFQAYRVTVTGNQ